MRSFFPRACSYTHFLSLARQACFHAFLLAQCRCSLSERKGHYYIDSNKLPVCHNLRIRSNKAFEGIAARGKGSTGWFYGLKLHLVINKRGELARFLLSPANNNNNQVLSYLFEGLQGKCYGDRGYLSSLMEELLEKGLHLVSRIRRSMKSMLLPLQDKLNLMKRGGIEAVTTF